MECDMAIYHLEAKVITRGTGRTACGAAAYMSCSAIYNDYDGIQHDYTRKGGLVWEHVFLPPMAPPEWSDRETLWNAVEAAEKTKDSRLAREFILALPAELERQEWIGLVSGFVQEQFVSDGMCADAAIHDTDGHNPHAHILLTVRPLDKDGTWQYKTEKEYLCVRGGEERAFTAAEFKVAQSEGWEKQYPYKVGRKKEYMTPSAAEARGLARASKHPKATRYGRQNPIAARWSSEEQLVAWRAAWADAVNRALEQKGVETRIDHRSHAARGLDEKPTVHEGYEARDMERAGRVSDRCELNRQIRADNALLKQFKESVRKLTRAVQTTLADVALAMEQLRQHMIVLRCHRYDVRGRRKAESDYLSKAEPMYQSYSDLTGEIREKNETRRSLQKELTALPAMSLFKRSELKRRMAQLTEEIGELEFRKNALVTDFGKESEKEMSAIPKRIKEAKATIDRLDELEARYTGDIEKSGQEFDWLRAKAKQFDLYELIATRLALRPKLENEARESTGVALEDYQICANETDVRNRESGMEVWYRVQTQQRKERRRERREYPQHKPSERNY
jgi:hypothetical protein